MTVAVPVADEAQRTAAVAECERNVLIDAGAGTGKTTILVQRLVRLVAPEDDGEKALAIHRVAAITFTRRAAGELRLRIRERLLEALAESALSETRRARLHDALSGLDTAYVGTIHSFADRLLRLRPVEAGLSPSYEIVEDDEELIQETFTRLLHGAENGTLGDMLEGSAAAERTAEASDVVMTALSCGIDAESREIPYLTRYGLDGLVAAFVRHRDLPPPDEHPVDADLDRFRHHAREFLALAEPLGGDAIGVRWLKWLARRLEEACAMNDPARIYRHVVGRFSKAPSNTTRAAFGNDEAAWDVWKAWNGDTRRKRLRDGSLREDVREPLERWMATRLVRLFPVVVELYERTKRRRRALDQIDLLVKLRDLMAVDRRARRFYQSLFDHVFVDEFQDTDPLQAEILLYLCEREARADRWDDVVLAPAKLTIVGDPKQSIYRFRRADVAMYDDVRKIVARGPHLNVRLSVNFRSRGSLIDWFNGCFESLLGAAPPDRPFDAVTGEVFHQPLAAHRADDGPPRVHVVPFQCVESEKSDAYRALEAEVLTRYLRWLVRARKPQIEDPTTGETRDVGYGDVAILAIATPTLEPLFRELDRGGVPYAARGGTLFLDDPLHRRFLLGLRAIADRDDGVAQAALLRPPFFALDPADLLWHVRGEHGAGGERRERAEAALEVVRDLRRRRFARSPGATARDLLERTAFARSVALGPNGAQRLARLRELCLLLEQEAAAHGLDYDGATARLRGWVTKPIQLDPPRALGGDAVQVLTVHQAKGLEFPVVVLWDGMCELKTRAANVAWRVARDGDAWRIGLDKLTWEEPANHGIAATEKNYADAERKRVLYVAATRARDLLVLPRPAAAKERHVSAALIDGGPAALAETLSVYVQGRGADWASEVEETQPSLAPTAPELETEVGRRWEAAATEAARPRFRPLAVSGEGERQLVEEEGATIPVPKRAGRYGPLFGETVHRAIGHALFDPSLSPARAVERAASSTGLAERRDEAAADVERARTALRDAELFARPGPRLRLEYPLAAPVGDGTLLLGYADLVAARGDEAAVIDFKTDQPPNGPVERTHPEYVAQVLAYARLLAAGGVAAEERIRCGLLFTADGIVRWIRR